MADNYSNLLNPELSISCPFIHAQHSGGGRPGETYSEANLKYMDLEKKSKTSYAKWFPSVVEKRRRSGNCVSGWAPVKPSVVLHSQHHSSSRQGQ
ncbi:hypothetical protein ACLB1Q_35410 [Escherichia coli]